ncbi:MAG TPA: Flp family type IVb pilin [Phycisphaerae bacterium]|nr:Flp family type IVb pilin [Phycisphaerae bacterium]
MIQIVKKINAFLKDEEGATATEYAVMLALIIVVCIAGVSALGEKVSDIYVDIESAMP